MIRQYWSNLFHHPKIALLTILNEPDLSAKKMAGNAPIGIIETEHGRVSKRGLRKEEGLIWSHPFYTLQQGERMIADFLDSKFIRRIWVSFLS